MHIPRTCKNLVADQHQLRDDAQDVEVRTEREQEVPKSQDLWKWWRAGAQSQDGRKGVDLCREVLGEEVRAELGIDDGEDLVHQGQSLVYAVHRTSNVAWTLLC